MVDSLDLEGLTEVDKVFLKKQLDAYHSSNEDTSKINALSNICENLIHDDWKKYQYYQYRYIITVLNNSPNNQLEYKKKLLISLASALNNMGMIYKTKGDINKALNYYLESLKIQQTVKDKLGIAACFNNIGAVYNIQGDIPKSLEYWHKSLTILEEIEHKQGLSATLNNIGVVYNNQGDIDIALDYWERCIKIRIKINDQRGLAESYSNVGMAYDSRNDYSKALEYLNKSLAIREELGDKLGKATAISNLASVYQHQGKQSKALESWQKCLKIQTELGEIEGELNSINNICVVYRNQGNINEAQLYGEKSLKIAQEIGYPSYIRRAAENLSSIYLYKKDYKQALILYKLHIKMRDSLDNENTQKAAIQQQAKYEYEKQKAINDAEHKKEIAIEQEAKEKQTILTFATGGGLGLVGVFLLIVFNRLKVTRKQKRIIEVQKQVVEDQKEVVEKAHTQLEEKNKEITDSIQYAKRIQNAILPPNKVVKEYLTESFILYKPKDIVAGDFYWLEQKDNNILFAAADCTGHGVPGAMVSVVCNNGLNRSVREYGLTDPGEILNKTREIVVQEFEKSEEEVKDGMDIAICSLEGNTLQYAGAHNPLWIIRKGSIEIEEIKANKQPIGQFDNPKPYTTHTIELNKGDSLYIFSDGYADQFGGEKGKKLKTVNFKKLLLSVQQENMLKQKELIDESFENWKGNLEQLDDVCIIGVRI